MAHFAAALQSLSSASCFLGRPRVSSAMVSWKVTAVPLRLHTRVIRCHVEDLSPKELHHIRKKEAQKMLRKVRKERRARRRAEELARIPQVKPNPATLKYRRPLQNWNKPWKKMSGAVANRHIPQQGLSFEQKEGSLQIEAASSSGRSANSELPESLWMEFETIYEEKMKKGAETIADVETLTDSADGDKYSEAAPNRRLSISSDSSADLRSESNGRYSRTKIVGGRQDWFPGGKAKYTGSSDSSFPGRVEFLSPPTTDSGRSFSQSPPNQVEDTEVSEFRDNGDLIGNDKLERDLSRSRVERFSESTNVTREQRMAAGKASARGDARIVIGERKGKKVYLSMGDADATVKKELPRSEVDEEKQLEWLVKQLNTVARPDGVHLSRVMRSGGLKITDGRSVVLVQKLGEIGNWKCALQVVEWLSSRHQFPPFKSRYLYTTLLAVLGKARRPIESLKIVNAMREHLATYPDMPAYRIIAVTLGQAGHLEELLELMQTLRRGPDMIHRDLLLADKGRLNPDTVVYNAALNACVSLRHWRLALWILDQIRKEKGARLNSASYGLAIEVMVKAGKLDLAWKILAKMELEGFHPNALTYRALVEGLGQAGKVDLAVQMVKQMEERGIVAVPGVYYALASTLCACGKWQDALLQVDRIGSLSGRPLVQTYTGLIKACKERGHWKDSISVFQHMREVCAPNIGTCNIMISLYGAHMMYDEAKNLFDEVKKGRICPPKLYRTDPRLSPDAFTYDAMLGACTNSQKWEDLEVLLRHMLLQGYQLDSNRHAWILQSLSEAGQDDLVAAMFTHLRSSKSATAELYVLMIKSCLRGGEQDKAFSHLEEMVNLNTRVSSSDVQKLEMLALLLSEEDQLTFMNKVESLTNTSDFDFTKDRSSLLTHRQHQSSAFKQLKTRHSLLNTSYGSTGGMKCRESTPRVLQNPILALGSSQDNAFGGADLHMSKDCPSEDVKDEHRIPKCQSDDGFRSTFKSSVMPGWELLWKRSSFWQPTSNESHLVEQWS